jgi:hypothetical protein
MRTVTSSVSESNDDLWIVTPATPWRTSVQDSSSGEVSTESMKSPFATRFFR